jgi:mannose PTS system EIIA component
MIGIIVATHGKVAEELLKGAEGIVGKQSHALALGLDPAEGPQGYEKRLCRAMEDLGAETGVLILTDMLGGTPCNVGLKQSRDPRYAFELVTGVNLPMLISALTNRHYMPLTQLSQKLVDDACRNIVRPLTKLREGA